MEIGNLSVLGVGFSCLDIIKFGNKDIIMLGGTAANVMTILALAGFDTSILMARYYGYSGEFIENAFKSRGVKCIFFADAKGQIPKIIEDVKNEKHFFSSYCPKCGQKLTRCKLPLLSHINKIQDKCNKFPNVFFFDRISEGIKVYAKQNKDGWNIYEPNSCRVYSNLIEGIQVANIVKYSEDRISTKITDYIVKNIKGADVVLLIVTMGKVGMKYIYRTETGTFSDWNYILATPVDKVIDSSGCGDWLTAVFIYFLLQKYPNYVMNLNEKYLYKCLIEAQKYATQNCFFIGAQGMLREQYMIDKINYELGWKMNIIQDLKISWKCSCKYCYNEYII